ncbi:hypothetical protein [Amycolatopsis pigmentata]|uniref:Secreted protein n=1 Tax=Amycolatopsis pigmentata TaxID=450801 RepID=A0ABW5G743_9PSEU
MHNRTPSPGPTGPCLLRAAVIAPAVIAVVLASGATAGAADSGSVPVEADLTAFGLLGPVGLAAVALGLIGMALGVVRQRRKSQAAAAEANRPVEPPAVVADSDEPTLTPYRRSA